MLSEDPDQTIVSTPRPRARPVLAGDDDDRTVVRPTGRPATAPASAAAAIPANTPPPRMPLQAMPVRTLALPPGFRLHEYRIDKVLGQGGFGITYLATDVNLRAPVAIKEYLPEAIAFRSSDKTVSPHSSKHRSRYEGGLESFLVEARTLAGFRHPNIVRVARFFEAHRTAYMVLEYERGSPLKQWWPAHQAQLEEKDLIPLLKPLLDGVGVMHAAGFLHRDIKPDNIQVRQEDDSLVLLDFGSARQAAVSDENADVALTPGYAPIEQYLDDAQGPWTDIYALGATLYWLVAGKAPPPADERGAGMPSARSLDEQRGGRFSKQFLDAIDWALQPEAADRPQDIAAWRSALFAAHAGSLGLQEALRASEASAEGTLRNAMQRAAVVARKVLVPTYWPLAVKMTLAMILTALLPMTVTGFYNLEGSRSALASSELRNLEQLARSTAGRLSQLIADSRHLASMLGADVDFRAHLQQPAAATARALAAKLKALVDAHPDIQLVMVMDADGNTLVSNDPDVMGRNFGFREYFRSAMRGQPHTTGLIVGSVAGASGMFCSQPVFDEQGGVIGAVVLRVHGSSFAGLLSTDKERSTFVVDGDGVVILHPDAKLLYHSLGPLAPERQEAIRADHRFRRDSVESLRMPALAKAMVGAQMPGHVNYASTITKSEEIAGFAPVQGHDWVVGISESRSRFEQPLDRLALHLLISIGLVGLLFLGLALRFARSIVQPIRALTRGADALKSGDYANASVSVGNRDEIGQLARTFNVMIDVLRQRERERGGKK